MPATSLAPSQAGMELGMAGLILSSTAIKIMIFGNYTIAEVQNLLQEHYHFFFPYSFLLFQ